ncbi:hypothetical protein F2P81_007557 [Scophthalmus maximus]|uniref:Uncharacterized protein n=1 Tax=Scophthalmus maximus TaxID=52904 RepID=A0A6A4TAX4_SCOMX|nr:hypothetical protein F2P81_007557 [Scophthalmus maximus]
MPWRFAGRRRADFGCKVVIQFDRVHVRCSPSGSEIHEDPDEVKSVYDLESIPDLLCHHGKDFPLMHNTRKKDDEESPVEKMSVSEIVGGDCTVEKRVPKYNNYTFN